MQHQLSQLITLNGFQTNPDVPGCERAVCTWMQKSWLNSDATRNDVSDAVVAPDLLGPQNIFMVKGWNRSVCALGVLFAAYQNEDLLKARSKSISIKFVSNLYLSTITLISKFDHDTKWLGIATACLGDPWQDYQVQSSTHSINVSCSSYWLVASKTLLPQRSFATIHATIVQPDSSQIVNTNRGIWIACFHNLLPSFLPDCSCPFQEWLATVRSGGGQTVLTLCFSLNFYSGRAKTKSPLCDPWRLGLCALSESYGWKQILI